MDTEPDSWVLVFVKAPTPGGVKTRLLSCLSAEAAAQLYRCLVSDTLETLAALRPIRTVIAYAPDARYPDLAWVEREPMPMVLQQGETLGERLLHAVSWAFANGARRVVALGSDAPTLSGEWVARAFRALNHGDLVIGPTLDGGYHLIGMNRLHPALFTDMPWSTPYLFERTVEKGKRLGLSVRVLEPVADLDTPEDVRRYLAQLESTARHTPACADRSKAGRRTAQFLLAQDELLSRIAGSPRRRRPTLR